MEFPFPFVGVGNNSQCYGPLGCLEITEDWYGFSRPVNVLPQLRETINTSFILRTRSNMDKVRIWAGLSLVS